MKKQQRVLTGITTSGIPHLGNLVGAILPAIKASNNEKNSSFLFLADYHSLIKNTDSNLTHSSSYEIAACWLACGLDPKKVIFYRQSDIPHIFELAWILGCLTSKGLLKNISCTTIEPSTPKIALVPPFVLFSDLFITNGRFGATKGGTNPHNSFPV